MRHYPPFPSSTGLFRAAGCLTRVLPFPWLFCLPSRPWVQEAELGAQFQLAAPCGETTPGEFGSDP